MGKFTFNTSIGMDMKAASADSFVDNIQMIEFSEIKQNKDNFYTLSELELLAYAILIILVAMTNIKQKGNKKVLSNLMKMHLLMPYIHQSLQNSLKEKQLKKNLKVLLFQAIMKLEFQLNIMLKLTETYMKLKSCLPDLWKLKKLKKDHSLLLKVD